MLEDKLLDAVIVDTCEDGHHSLYVKLLVEELFRSRPELTVAFYLPEGLVGRVERELGELERHYLRAAWVPCLPGMGFKAYAALRSCLEKMRPKHVLLLYFDPFFYLQSCGLGLKCSFSAIWFRPTFHYYRFGLESGSWIDHLTGLAKRILLKCALLRSTALRTLFVHDALAAEYGRSVYRTDKIAELVTPLGRAAPAAEPCPQLRWDSNARFVALMFGSICRRKGILDVLASLSLMNTEARKKLRLVLMGRFVPSELQELRDAVRTASRLEGVELQVEDRFVSDEEMDQAISKSHFVLMPYRGFKGSSGVLIRSALLGRPVLSCRDGLVGHEVRKYGLGCVVSSRNPEEIARALERICTERTVAGFDVENAAEFAAKNSPKAFAATLAQRLGAEAHL